MNNISEKLKSAYKKLHSSKTVPLKVKDDILQAVDNGGTVVLLLLDLSAAFDTVDHSFLLHRLKMPFGIKGPRVVQNLPGGLESICLREWNHTVLPGLI